MNMDMLAEVFEQARDCVEQAKVSSFLGEKEISQVYWQQAYSLLSMVLRYGDLPKHNQIMLHRNLAVCATKTNDFKKVIDHVSQARSLEPPASIDMLLGYLEAYALRHASPGSN